MNCEYILRNDIHEKFLRGFLTDEQKTEFQSHLDSCESCRKIFENERILSEGIRSVGRKSMKLEIERQVEQLRDEQSPTDWTLLFKVAAVLFFLVILPGTLYYLNTDLFIDEAEGMAAKTVHMAVCRRNAPVTHHNGDLVQCLRQGRPEVPVV